MMNDRNLRDELLKLETYPEDLQKSIQDVLHLRERPLKAWERPTYIVSCALMALFIVAGPICLVKYCPDFLHKIPMHILAALPFLFLLVGWLIVSMLTSLKKGMRRFRDDQIGVYGGAAFVLFIFVTGMIVNTGHLDAAGLAVSLLAVIGVIWVRIQEAEIRIREHVLWGELAVAQLVELVTARNGAGVRTDSAR